MLYLKRMLMTVLCLCPGLAGAEVQSVTSLLDEIVVTGTRTERTLLDSPVRTELVTAEEIERTHARSLKEALQDVPGLQLREVHGKAGYEVWLQGVDADRVLVLVDGLPVTATTGSSVDVSQLSVLDIERIEVVKGAVSAQYGSAGLGGVVNVITRPVPVGPQARLVMDAGSYGDQNPSGSAVKPGRYSARAALSQGGERLGVRLSASTQSSDGVDPEPSTWARPGDEYVRNDLNGQIEWRPGEGHRVKLTGSFFEEVSESRYETVVPGLGIDRQAKDEDVRRWRAVVTGEHRFSPGLSGGWALVHEDLENLTEKYNATRVFDQRDASLTVSQGSGNLDWMVGDTHRLQGGIDVRRESLSQRKDQNSELESDGESSREGYELWLQDSWLPTDRLELVTGVRVQNDSDFGYHTAPKLNLRLGVYETGTAEAFLRAGVGSGYRVPNLKERYYRFDHSQLGYMVLGNPELEPESSVSYQLGWGMHYRKQLWFDANGFVNDINDLIQTTLDQAATDARGDGVVVYRYNNLARARTWGIETSAGWQPDPDWGFRGSYTWTRTEDRDTGRELNRRPHHQFRFSVDGPTPLSRLAWSARFRAASSEYVDSDLGLSSPGYGVMDLKLNYRPRQWLTVFGGVDNLAGTQRDFGNPHDFRPVEGRFIYAGFSLLFSPGDSAL